MSKKVSYYKNKLWELCKTYVRLRDHNICQRCGKMVVGRQAHTSHVVPKSHGNILRYDDQNLKVMCNYCHKWWHGNPIESSEWFETKFPRRHNYLMKRKEMLMKFKEDDWKEMITGYELAIEKETENEL